MITIENIKSIHNTATDAARRAEADFIARHGEPGYCGFAWVTVSEKASTKLGRALKQVGFRKSYQGGLDLWNPGGSGTQSMDIKEAGAQAYADVLRSFGINAYMSSRAD
jgi:3-oxoacyl-(acyl-carrier-protein) synthase